MGTNDSLTHPRIIIQPDWFEYVQNKELPVDVYVDFKPGSSHSDLSRTQQNIHALLSIQAPTGNESTVFETSVTDHFETSYIENGQISVKLKGSAVRHTFKGPKRIFKSAHDSINGKNDMDTTPIVNVPERKILSSTSKIHPNCLDISQGGLSLVGLSDGIINVFENENGDIRRTLTGHVQDVYTARFFPSEDLLILSGGADFRVKIWTLENSGECRQTLTGHTSRINDLAIIDNGEQIVSVSNDGSARLWNWSKEPNQAVNTICQLDKGINGCCIFESSLVCACEDGYVRMYDVNGNDKKATGEVKIGGAVNCVCYGSDYIVCGTEQGTISICDLRQTKSVIHSWKELRSKITSLTPVNDDGGILVTTGDGSTFYHAKTMLINPNIETEMGPILYDVVDYTGPENDMVLNARIDKNNNIYTVARDGYVRVYDKVQEKK
ncbi:unnamed protein product [Didymodactylos carnosus]|uniref:Proteasomal ATPase-associated factor 1 n=1 Tax=Didymodactylos carnosus TaxID=1234261 RepID=A0A814USI1_9BILA|nr:unnamed protein product [Didymodactylos carnosus]CAF1178588.1 unnamed protein product [Didymodactylos carnosus]CAF3557454.1 unnamed protein product [Didymodactylos carnosus]CAF3942795.1 unnamed protein product [Didymodactylos carnosus]